MYKAQFILIAIIIVLSLERKNSVYQRHLYVFNVDIQFRLKCNLIGW